VAGPLPCLYSGCRCIICASNVQAGKGTPKATLPVPTVSLATRQKSSPLACCSSVIQSSSAQQHTDSHVKPVQHTVSISHHCLSGLLSPRAPSADPNCLFRLISCFHRMLRCWPARLYLEHATHGLDVFGSICLAQNVAREQQAEQERSLHLGISAKHGLCRKSCR
jgi:hypothetical protein